MAKQFQERPYDDATMLKLKIFREFFREWLPVFINNPSVERLYVYDLFAGKGQDMLGNPGSPLVLLDEAVGADGRICESLKKKRIYFGFNDKDEAQELKKNVENFINGCIEQNCKNEKCHISYIVGDYDFKEVFYRDTVHCILQNQRYAKFVILDQFGFSQVDEHVFEKLVAAPKTDFVFFIASSFINRFKNHPYVKKYFDTSKIKFKETPPVGHHKLIANYFKSLCSLNDYFIHHFTIKKGSNYYGLIFGSSHSLGMEKFLKICWNHDELAGESTENVYLDYVKGEIFYNPENTNKKELVRHQLVEKIIKGVITDNHMGFHYVIGEGCLPELFTNTVKMLEKNKVIFREGEINNQSTKIHKAPKYNIKLL